MGVDAQCEPGVCGVARAELTQSSVEGGLFGVGYNIKYDALYDYGFRRGSAKLLVLLMN